MTTFKVGDLVEPVNKINKEVIEAQILKYWKEISPPYFPLVVEYQRGNIVRFTNSYECFADRLRKTVLDRPLEDYM